MKKRTKLTILILFFILLLGVGACTKAPQPGAEGTVESRTLPSFGPTYTPTPTSAPTQTPTPTLTPTPTSTPTPTQTPTPTPTPTPSSVAISMVGDILLHDRVNASALLEDGKYDYSHIFENLKEDISAADIALVNQEVIIGGEDLGVSGYPRFNAPYEVADALVGAGFDVILHATNHALDVPKKGNGKQGIINCLNYWRENYPEINVLGIADSEEAAEEICIIEKNGIKIAILNYTYGTNGISLPKDMPYAVKLMTADRMEEMAAEIKKAKEAADFVVVCPHWGEEYTLTPSKTRITSSGETKPGEIEWSNFFLENGVDLVIGAHPHVIQPVEWLEDENGKRMLVYYSLGNFVNWTASSGKGIMNRMVGGMANVTLTRDETGEVVISQYGITPLVCHVTEGSGGVTVYKFEDYNIELASENGIIAQDATFSYEACYELCKKVWKGLFD
ncbi:MAG: CapA family protein [Lachnospiraceae bacterium]|nr:CapA family protein [Lachnospiraceae bacterium]